VAEEQQTRAELQPGQVWECHRGRHVGARFEVLAQVPGWDTYWSVRSLTAKGRPTREIWWPGLTSDYRLVDGG
jgi:hypothetical protein